MNEPLLIIITVVSLGVASATLTKHNLSVIDNPIDFFKIVIGLTLAGLCVDILSMGT